MKDNILKSRSPSSERIETSSPLLSFPTYPNDIISLIDAEDEALIQQVDEVDEEMALVQHAQQGDMEASNRLVQSTYPRVLNYFRNKLRSRPVLKLSIQRVEELAEVKTQDTYERAWKKLPDYHLQGKPFLVILYGIAQKIWQEMLRELVKERNVDDFEAHPELEAERSSCPEEMIIRWEELEELQRALQTLSPTEQRIIHLHYREKQSYQQIARSLNITENNAKTRSYRSRKKLKQLLAPRDMPKGHRQSKQRKRSRLCRRIPRPAKHDKQGGSGRVRMVSLEDEYRRPMFYVYYRTAFTHL